MGADLAGQEGAGGELEPAECGRVFGLRSRKIRACLRSRIPQNAIETR
jgi:hypothetical protein